MFDKYAKAIVGAIIAGLGSLQTAMIAANATHSPIPGAAWVGVAITFLTVLGGVWGVGEFNDRIEVKKAELAASTPTTTVVAATPSITMTTGGASTTTFSPGKHEATETELDD